MYLALGLEPGAPSAEIRRAYRNLSLKLHPDASRDPRTAGRFAMVAKAYGILSVLERERPGASAKPLAGPDRIDLFELGAELTTHTDPERRSGAARRLGLSGKRSAWVFLRKGLYDPEPAVVASCVRAAAVLGLVQGSGEIAGVYERAGHELKDAILEIAKATRDGLFGATLETAKNDDDHRRRMIALALQRESWTDPNHPRYSCPGSSL
jgi:hypothetical protein